MTGHGSAVQQPTLEKISRVLFLLFGFLQVFWGYLDMIIHQIVKLSGVWAWPSKDRYFETHQAFREQKNTNNWTSWWFFTNPFRNICKSNWKIFSPNKFRGFEEKTCLRPPPTSELLESCFGWLLYFSPWKVTKTGPFGHPWAVRSFLVIIIYTILAVQSTAPGTLWPFIRVS